MTRDTFKLIIQKRFSCINTHHSEALEGGVQVSHIRSYPFNYFVYPISLKEIWQISPKFRKHCIPILLKLIQVSCIPLKIFKNIPYPFKFLANIPVSLKTLPGPPLSKTDFVRHTYLIWVWLPFVHVS